MKQIFVVYLETGNEYDQDQPILYSSTLEKAKRYIQKNIRTTNCYKLYIETQSMDQQLDGIRVYEQIKPTKKTNGFFNVSDLLRVINDERR